MPLRRALGSLWNLSERLAPQFCATSTSPLCRSSSAFWAGSKEPPSASRAFSATPTAHVKTIMPHRLPSHLIPPYPYGERPIYKQSNKGLYGSARIRFGNVVSEKYHNKSKCFWRPNVHVKILESNALGARVKTRLTLRVYKTICREGGLDNYLLKSKPARVKELGPGGWNLRWLLMQTKTIQERFNKERQALGLDFKPIYDRDDLIQYALDFATPGPLNARNRLTIRKLRDVTADSFALDKDITVSLDGGAEMRPQQQSPRADTNTETVVVRPSTEV